MASQTHTHGVSKLTKKIVEVTSIQFSILGGTGFKQRNSNDLASFDRIMEDTKTSLVFWTIETKSSWHKTTLYIYSIYIYIYKTYYLLAVYQSKNIKIKGN